MNIGRLKNIPKKYFRLISGIALTIALLPPVIVISKFWDYIEFSPSIFINEWLKIVIPGIVIVLIIEYFIVKYESSSYKKAILPIIQDSLFNPSRKLIEKLNQYTALGDMSKNEKEEYQSDISLNWYTLMSAKSIIALFALKYSEDKIIKKLELFFNIVYTEENKNNMNLIMLSIINNNQNIAILVHSILRNLVNFVNEIEIILKHLEENNEN